MGGEISREPPDSSILGFKKQANQKEKPFKIMSWNIDGLDVKHVQARAYGVVTTILK